MKKSIFIQWSIFFFFVIHLPAISAQNYFKLIESPENSYFQSIAQFSNGDILITDTEWELNPSTGRRNIYLLRVDECGLIVWSKTFYLTDKFMTLDKIFVDEFDLVYVYGTALEGLREDIYVLKLTSNGENINFRIYTGAINDNFTASLFVKNEQVTVFGCWYDIVNQGNNHILKLDENLNPISSKTYSNCETYGEGLLTDDGGFLYHTGFKIVKTNLDGTVEWAKRVNGLPFAQSQGIPLEISDGFIFNVYKDEKQWFYKLSKNGNLLWQSDKFPSYYHISRMIELSNEKIMAVYQCLDSDGNKPCFLLMDSTGIISKQYVLEIDFPINAGFSYLTATDDFRINFLGNADMSFSSQHSHTDYLMQFNLNDMEGDCFSWVPFDDLLLNDETFILENETVVVANNPVEVEISNTLVLEDFDFSFTEICGVEFQEINIDTFLNCEEEWVVELTSNNFIWEDGSMDNPRTLTEPNTYSVTIQDCLIEKEINYNLKKESCICNIFIPNAFTPNEDGFNDELEFFSNCPIENFKVSIFNRWGGIVFETQNINDTWDGYLDGKSASSGVYAIVIKGRSIDNEGNSNEINMVKDVTLYR